MDAAIFLADKFRVQSRNDLIIDRTHNILEGTTKEGYKIIYGRLLDSDPSHFVYNDAMKLLNMTIDLWLYTEGTCDGHVILFDMKNVSFGHVGRLSPMGLKKFLYYLQEGLPVRLRSFHFMNASPVIDVILNMMRPFMKKQLLDMVRLKSLHTLLINYLILRIKNQKIRRSNSYLI